MSCSRNKSCLPNLRCPRDSGYTRDCSKRIKKYNSERCARDSIRAQGMLIRVTISTKLSRTQHKTTTSTTRFGRVTLIPIKIWRRRRVTNPSTWVQITNLTDQEVTNQKGTIVRPHVRVKHNIKNSSLMQTSNHEPTKDLFGVICLMTRTNHSKMLTKLSRS